ncbi:MAG: hypothetical protein WAZ40_03840, partial [Minisyncoccia bacterium]
MEKENSNKSFNAFLENIKHEARMDTTESKDEHARRLLDEVHEVLSGGVQSREEATSLLAKLDIVTESVDDFTLKAAAQTFIADIKERYPGISA